MSPTRRRDPGTPPPLADRILERVLPGGVRGLSIIADLHQEFREVRARRGPVRADVWYWTEALALAVRYGRSVHHGRRDEEEGESMQTLIADLRYGARMLRKTPALTVTAVLTIALGVGLTTFTYSTLDGTVLRGLPVPDQDRLMHVSQSIPSMGVEEASVPFLDFLDLRERQRAFEDLAAYQWTSFNLAGEEAPPERVTGALVSANALDVVGVAPLMGRLFQPGDDAPNAAPRMVISHALWENRFASDPAILGRMIRVHGVATEIVGVMPEGFRFPFDHAAWMPFRYDPATTARRSYTMVVFGRRAETVTPTSVASDLDRVGREVAAIYPEENSDVHFIAAPYAERDMPRQIRAVMFLMLAATFGVLLIACANVTNLLLARAAARAREVAVRSALGASRLRVIRQMLSEVLVLALVGGALGVALAWFGVEAFGAAILDIQKPYWIDIRLDLPALGFALGVTLFAALATGTVPAFRATGRAVGDTLRDEARGSSSRRTGRVTRALVVGEIAVSCGLLIAAGLMVRSIVNLRNTDLGFEPEGVLSGLVALPTADYPTRDERRAFFQAMEERLEAEPGVVAVGLTSSLPGLGASGWRVMVDGATYPTDRDIPFTHGSVVTLGFFDVMRMRPLQGRDFLPTEIWDAAEPAAVVSESFARRILGDVDPLGARVRIGRADSNLPWMRIVGVVPDVHVGGGVGGIGDDRVTPEYLYVTPGSLGVTSLYATVRTQGPPEALAPRLRSLVTELDPNLPMDELGAVPAKLQEATWAFGLFGSLFALFGAAALFMASVGLYGVMAFSVEQRRQELGVRMALGASRRKILRMVLNEGALQLAVGSALGLALGYALAKPLSFVTYGVSLADPFLYLFIVSTLGTVGAAACLIPARSATRADPVTAMRST